MVEEMEQEIFEKGQAVFISHSINTTQFEEWVKKVAALSGQRVDWHFMGGRAVVRCLGDAEKVKQAILDLFDEHEQLFMAEMRAMNMEAFYSESGSGACFYINDELVPVKTNG